MMKTDESKKTKNSETKPRKPYKKLTFPIKEYERRLNDLKAEMQARDLDSVMITGPANILYLTGYQTTGYGMFQALIVPLHKEPFMITRLLEASNVTARTWVSDPISYEDTEDAVKVAWQAFSDKKLLHLSLGVELNSYYFPSNFEKQFLKTFTNVKIIDCTGIVEKLRLVKSQAELQAMRFAARITEKGMKAAIDSTHEGVYENDIAAATHYAMYRYGGEYPAVAPYITSGPRTIIGHATWEGRKIKHDEPVFIEIGGCFRRYHTAMMRTVYIGKPPKEMIEAEKLINEAIEAAMTVMKPGVTAETVDSVTRAIIERNTIGATQITRSGYSIGISFAPSWDEGHILSFKPGEKQTLDNNMTFHLIPWIQLPKLQMVLGTSETVYVTPQGARSFFRMKRKLYRA